MAELTKVNNIRNHQKQTQSKNKRQYVSKTFTPQNKQNFKEKTLRLKETSSYKWYQVYETKS